MVAWGAIAGIAVVGTTVLLTSRNPDAGLRPSSTPMVGDDLHSLVVDPSDPSRLFIGSHSGVSVSTDAGRTWRPVESLAGADAMGWAFSDQAILVGGHPGIEVSLDGGRRFAPRNEGLPATDIHALGAGGGVVYAASPAVGVLASTDDGRSWEIRTDQVGGAFMGRILVDPEDADHIVAPDMQAGAVESTDGGGTWNALGGVGGAMWVSWDAAAPDRIIVTSFGQAAVSTDGGTSWRPMVIPSGASIVEIDPQDPTLLYAAVLEAPDARVFVSRDGGESWAEL